jgi:hypothetical protein
MREAIKRILEIVPGYEGYEAKEKRRDADKTLRTTLARQFTSEQQAITRLTQKAVDSGQFACLDRIEDISQQLGFFIARLESAPRGYSGWFDEAQIDEADLDQIYEFDARLADSIPLLREHIEYVEKEFRSGEQFDEALDELSSFINGLNSQFDARQEFVTLGKRASG